MNTLPIKPILFPDAIRSGLELDMQLQDPSLILNRMIAIEHGSVAGYFYGMSDRDCLELADACDLLPSVLAKSSFGEVACHIGDLCEDEALERIRNEPPVLRISGLGASASLPPDDFGLSELSSEPPNMHGCGLPPSDEEVVCGKEPSDPASGQPADKPLDCSPKAREAIRAFLAPLLHQVAFMYDRERPRAFSERAIPGVFTCPYSSSAPSLEAEACFDYFTNSVIARMYDAPESRLEHMLSFKLLQYSAIVSEIYRQCQAGTPPIKDALFFEDDTLSLLDSIVCNCPTLSGTASGSHMVRGTFEDLYMLYIRPYAFLHLCKIQQH